MTPLTLEVIYIVPSRYDDDGYVQRYWRGIVPSNSLAVLKSLTAAVAETNPFPDVTIKVTGYDDGVEKVPLAKIAKLAKRPDTRVIVGLVGVQSGQFPRAVDLAMKLKSLGVPSMIGGFHVSGMLELFDTIPSELQHLIDNDITIIRGESESPGVLEELLRDCLEDRRKPIYHFPKAPDIENVPLPVCDKEYIKKFAVKWATIDSSRGCPYGCTFCTVINVQGRKMRCRSAEGVLDALQKHFQSGVHNFFFTDDNFARNRQWEKVFDGLIHCREKEGKNVKFMMQVDTQSSKIPSFVEKAAAAGCRSVFVGMESVNTANIDTAGKSQNNVHQYRQMVQTWQKAGVLVHVGYIIGFPHDTIESVKTDVAFLRDHVGVDEVSFFMLTPLPGSVDHRNMVLEGFPIDGDLNKYDSFHETFQHPKMAVGEWTAATHLAYTEFYSKESIVRILRRIDRQHYWHMFMNFIWYRYAGVYNHSHPMMTGLIRQKDRNDRRSGLPKEGFFRYWWRRTVDTARGMSYYLKLFWEFQEIWFLTRKPQLRMSLAQSASEEFDRDNPALTLGARAEIPVAVGIYTDIAMDRVVNQWDYWSSVKQRVSELNWAGQVQSAATELKTYLGTSLKTLTEHCENLKTGTTHSCKQQFAKLERIRRSTLAMLRRLERLSGSKMNKCNSSDVVETQQSVEDEMIAPLEEMSFRYVRIRRRINDWRQRILSQIIGRRLRPFDGLKAACVGPVVFCSEAYLAVRFGIAALRKE